jgi:biopolymer transport protein TolQ
VSEGLSIWSLIIEASFVVQCVMLVLVAASITSWVMIANRFLVLKEAKDSGLEFENTFWSGIDLGTLYKTCAKNTERSSCQEAVFVAGFSEFVKLRKEQRMQADTLMEAVQRSMRVAFSREQERLEKHLSFLATVGSTSPYIGLFGTVIGIMNSFRSLASQSQATLSLVAPGIAEALVATAIGLFAAIPAVIAYNRYATATDSLLKNCVTFTDEFSSILHAEARALSNSKNL